MISANAGIFSLFYVRSGNTLCVFRCSSAKTCRAVVREQEWLISARDATIIETPKTEAFWACAFETDTIRRADFGPASFVAAAKFAQVIDESVFGHIVLPISSRQCPLGTRIEISRERPWLHADEERMAARYAVDFMKRILNLTDVLERAHGDAANGVVSKRKALGDIQPCRVRALGTCQVDRYIATAVSAREPGVRRAYDHQRPTNRFCISIGLVVDVETSRTSYVPPEAFPGAESKGYPKQWHGMSISRFGFGSRRDFFSLFCFFLGLPSKPLKTWQASDFWIVPTFIEEG